MRESALTKLLFALLLALAAMSAPSAHGQSSAPNEEAYITDGPVNAIALTADRVILGGDFSRVGAYYGGGIPLSAATGKPTGVFPRVNGTVYCCIADGKGGWYVGGAFDAVGYLPRQNLAHILPTGRVDEDFQADANATVYALALSGSTLYAGGAFTTLGGQDRKRIAAIDLLTGTVSDAWNPIANGDVYALAAQGKVVYAGGKFKIIGGEERHWVAALSTATGAASAWDANLTSNYDERVLTLAVSGSTVYVGSSYPFTDAEGRTHKGLAAFDAASGAVKAWNPPIEGRIECMSLSGATLYLGGAFTLTDAAGNSNSACLAAVDTASGQFRDAWPDANANVHAVLASGTKVFVGGWFNETLPGLNGSTATLGTAIRNYLACIDIATGAVTAWDPNPDGQVYALAAYGATVFVGGHIHSLNMQPRAGLAALDALTGEATDWDPALSQDGSVKQMAVGGSTLYVEGAFSSIGGQVRSGLGAVDLASGAPTAWNPPQFATAITYSTAHGINAMAVAGGKVYVGGAFTKVGGQARKYLVALDPATGAATGADLAVDNEVNALAASGPTLYVGGKFTAIGGQARGRIAALDAGSGAVTAWNPNADNEVFTLAADRTQVYAVGMFSAIGGQSRQYIAALAAGTGLANGWNPRLNLPYGPHLALSGSDVYLAGRYSLIDGERHYGLAAFGSAIPATVSLWTPQRLFASTYPFYALAASDTAVYVGGSFSGIGGTSRPYLAKFSIYRNPGRLSLSSNHLDFLQGTPYAVDVEHKGAPTTRTLTLTNAGGGPLVFLDGDAATPGLAITGEHASEFKIRSVKPSTLTPLAVGESVTVTVQFAPSTTTRTLGLDAMLEVRSDSPITPDLYIPLTGDAVPVRLSGFEAE